MKAYLMLCSHWDKAYPEDDRTYNMGIAFSSEDRAKAQVEKLTKRAEKPYRLEWRKMSKDAQDRYITKVSRWYDPKDTLGVSTDEDVYVHTKPSFGTSYSYQEITLI